MTTLTIHLFPISPSFLSPRFPVEFSSFSRSSHRSKRKLTSSLPILYWILFIDGPRLFRPDPWLLRTIALVTTSRTARSSPFPYPTSCFLFFPSLYNSCSLTFHPFPVSIPSLAIPCSQSVVWLLHRFSIFRCLLVTFCYFR